jgi:hypothetical protein
MSEFIPGRYTVVHLARTSLDMMATRSGSM